MAYTEGVQDPNYWNFMMDFRGGGGGIGRKSWERASAAGYNPNQIKTAIQQLHRSRGIGVGSGVREDYMRGVQGIAHGLNRFQGGAGNLGLQHYNRAKKAGFDISQIPTLAAQGGMFLPVGAQAQWAQDMQDKYAPPPQPEFEMPEFGSQSGGGKVLGTSAMGVRSALSSKDSTGGTQEAFGRKKKKSKTNYAAQLTSNPLG